MNLTNWTSRIKRHELNITNGSSRIEQRIERHELNITNWSSRIEHHELNITKELNILVSREAHLKKKLSRAYKMNVIILSISLWIEDLTSSTSTLNLITSTWIVNVKKKSGTQKVLEKINMSARAACIILPDINIWKFLGSNFHKSLKLVNFQKIWFDISSLNQEFMMFLKVIYHEWRNVMRTINNY